MRVALVDFNTSFYDRHWAFALTATLRQCGIADIHYRSFPAKLRYIKKISELKPDLVLYSVFSYAVPETIGFDAALKSVYSCKSILGGPGATFSEIDITKTTFDAICVGEGEQALKDYFASGLKSGANLITRDKPNFTPAPLVDLSLEPMPDRSIVYRDDHLLRDIKSHAFMTGRGCPYRCSYCFNHVFNQIFGTKIRKRPVSQVIENIQHVHDNYGLDFVSFQDDTFCIDKKWLEEFTQIYPSKIGIPFACNVRANLVDDDIARMLRTAGVRAVSWSVETADDQLRNEVLKRNMTKEQMDSTAELLKRHKIPYRIVNIIGLPGETPKQVEETVAYNVKLGSVFASANIFTPYPKLELTEYALLHGHIDSVGDDVPKNFFRGSALKVDHKFNIFLIKTFCLIPFFVWFPVFWRSNILRRMLYGTNRYLLRVIYEATYLVSARVIYGLKFSSGISLRMAWRYLVSL